MRRTVGMMAAQGTLVVCLLVPGLAFAANTPSSPAPATTQPTAPAQTDATNGVGEFVPLTHLPQIQTLSQAQGFATFVNTFYKILIGVGAVLAVLMIMYAGVQFMTSRGSVTGNEKAKSRIQNAIFGLILVLAPTIVFSIINPDILHLNLGTEFQQLKQDKGVDQGAFQTNVQGSGAGTCPVAVQAVTGDTCPSNSQPTTQSCCKGISALGTCCAPKSTGSYVLAAYVIRTNSSTKKSCYSSIINTYPTQSECATYKNTLSATFGVKDGWTVSGVTYARSCELGDSTYTLTVPGNVPVCTN